jgi:hypothetical protein
MPAIQPARLKIRAEELSTEAANPEGFCRAYHELLDYYADRTFRPGQVGEPPPLLPTYHVPKPVLRSVEKEMSQFAEDDRGGALVLADALWGEEYLEFKLLAASLLGKISPVPTKSVFRRVESWTGPSTEKRLEEALVHAGLERILHEYPDLYFQKILTWLRSKKLNFNLLGLLAIPPLLESGLFDDYPPLFKQLSRKMRLEGNPLKTDILAAIEVLATRSPEETAFFLSQTMKPPSENPNIAWYVRKSLKFFPPNLQQYLREILLSNS